MNVISRNLLRDGTSPLLCETKKGVSLIQPHTVPFSAYLGEVERMHASGGSISCRQTAPIQVRNLLVRRLGGVERLGGEEVLLDLLYCVSLRCVTAVMRAHEVS